LSAALVYERPRVWTWHIGSLQPIEAEAGAFDHCLDRPVQMAAPADTLPCRRQPVLPSPHAFVRCQSVLHEQQPAAWLEHAANLAEAPSASGIVHSVQVVTTVSIVLLSWEMAAADSSINLTGMGIRSPTCRAIAMSCGAGSRPTISRNSGRRTASSAHSDLQHPPFRRGDHPLPIRRQASVTHHEMAESR
jgi:hypothetical protein